MFHQNALFMAKSKYALKVEKALESMTKKELLMGARKSYINACSMQELSMRAAENGNYGLGCSLLILSMEECVKSIVILMLLVDVKPDFEVGEIFEKHSSKHFQADRIIELLSILIPIVNIFESGITKSEKMRRIMAFSLSYVTGQFKIDSVENEVWFKETANNLKNNGLYVGVANEQFTSPFDVSKSDFLRAKSMNTMFIEALGIINNLNEDTLMRLGALTD